ncbi:hypothetical protein AB1N83_000168 [Pleurotus pulmonarius]
MTEPTMTIDASEAEGTTPEKRVIHITVPPRWYLIPGTAFIAGAAIGVVRGGQTESLRFLAENAHRPPTTVEGWYFYNKTKNYRIMLAGLKSGGWEAAKLAALGVGWVGIEEGVERAGLGDVREVIAGVGTAAMFSGAYRLPMRAGQRAVIAGLMIGGTLAGLRVGRRVLEEQKRALE